MNHAQTRLLIVDDDIPMQTNLAQIFSDIGYKVRTAQDGFSALFEIERELPDILLFDLKVPGMSALELLLIVRRRFPSIRVFATTADYPGDSMPPGVVADKFHHKGAGVELLVQSVEAMAQPLDSISKRLCLDDLFGFPMYEQIPSRPTVEISMPQARSPRFCASQSDSQQL